MKKVFITGASSGIGLAIGQSLVAHGHEVWGTSRNPERIPKLPHWHAVRLDLANPLSVEQGFNAALAEAVRFDVLINNAGAPVSGSGVRSNPADAAGVARDAG